MDHKVIGIPDNARTDRMLEIAELLESDKVAGHFGMHTSIISGYKYDDPYDPRIKTLSEFLRDDNTCACIAGYVYIKYYRNSSAFSLHKAMSMLKLDKHSGRELFVPEGFTPKLTDYIFCTNPMAAAAVLRHCVETRLVDWSIADDLIDDDAQHGAEVKLDFSIRL